MINYHLVRAPLEVTSTVEAFDGEGLRLMGPLASRAI
jgi:hypothetical protein